MNKTVKNFYVTEVENVLGCKTVADLCAKFEELYSNYDGSVAEVQDTEAFDVPDVAVSVGIV